MPQRHRRLALSILSLILFYVHFSYLKPSRPPRPHAILPANSTLGFGAIIAVSHAHSPRRASLLWAANLTDLDIVIPSQPVWTEEDIENFKSKDGSTISTGSAKAWLGHLNALDYFLATTHTTALIIEDDVDFSLALRRRQVPLLAGGVRRLFSNASTPTTEEDEKEAYWGDTWDILYPGHCDDLPSPLYTSHPSLLYTDASAPHSPALHPATDHFMTYLNIPPHARLLHRAFYPFCTFAYAVTRQSASRIVSQFSREKKAGISAFDVQLLEACRIGWRCWSVGMEIFHHGVGGSEISRADKIHQHGGVGSEGMSVKQDKGYARATWNIECGARSRELWVEEGDVEGRAQVRRVVRGFVERGECPIGRGGKKGWRGCEEGECGGQS